MTAFNAVRFRVKPGRDEDFLAAHRNVETDWPGLRHANIVQSGARDYFLVGEWDDPSSLSAAMPQMIATLDSFRDCLEDLGDGRGVTDPVSGPVVMQVK